MLCDRDDVPVNLIKMTFLFVKILGQSEDWESSRLYFLLLMYFRNKIIHFFGEQTIGVTHSKP